MSGALLSLLLVGLFGGVAAVSLRQGRARHKALTGLAERLDLTVVRGSLTKPWLLTGEFRGFDVNIRTDANSDGDDVTWVELSGGELDPAMTVRKVGLTTALTKAFRGPDIEVGDAGFDAAVQVLGDDATMVALMDHRTREQVGKQLPDGTRLSEGTLSYSRQGFWRDVDGMVRRIEILADLGRRLTLAPEDIPARLSSNATGDPLVAVRLRNLRLLLSSYPGHSAADAAVQAASEDESVWMRIEAACYLGEEHSERIENTLLLQLAREELGVKLEATRALGRIGTVRAVERLLPLTKPMMGTAELRAAARDAIAEIQARAPGAEAGQVSVAEPLDLAGAVSVEMEEA